MLRVGERYTQSVIPNIEHTQNCMEGGNATIIIWKSALYPHPCFFKVFETYSGQDVRRSCEEKRQRWKLWSGRTIGMMSRLTLNVGTIIIRHVGRRGGLGVECRHSTSDAIITNHSFVLSAAYCSNYSMIVWNWNKVNSYISASEPLSKLPNSSKLP